MTTVTVLLGPERRRRWTATEKQRMAGPGLLAHIAVSKFGDGLPLHRQSEIYARQDVDIDCSTMAGG
jgi:transposase